MAWGFARRADALGVDLIQNCEVTGIEVVHGRAVAVETTRGRIAAGTVAVAAAGHSSVVAAMAGFELPLQSHPLQALVSELLEPVHPTVVMSNAVHVYVSQAHKGELVMGAGIDSYNSYGQRGAFHIIEQQMAAAVELFPIFARAHVLRTWAGVVDVTPDASPIIRATPAWTGCMVELRVGYGRLQGHARHRLGVRRHDRPRASRTRWRNRSRSTASRAVRSSTSTAPPRWRTETPGRHRAADRVPAGAITWNEDEFHYGGAAGVAYPDSPADVAHDARLGAATCSSAPTPGPDSPGAGRASAKLPPLVHHRAGHRDEVA